MKLLLLFGLVAVAVAVRVVKTDDNRHHFKNKKHHCDGELVNLDNEDKAIMFSNLKEMDDGHKKSKCNLAYLACVKKGGDTEKNHIKCGKKFICCSKVCYWKCKRRFVRCLHYHDMKLCKGVWSKCAKKCPHYSKCGKKCKATFDKCRKSKGKQCLKNFVDCLKKCKPKTNY